MKNILKVVMVIIGTLIGAGFASGKEIYIFFMKYGQKGILGIMISGIFSGIIIYLALTKIKKINAEKYEKLLDGINSKNKKINKLINYIVNAFLLISFFIMVAGFGAYINQEFKIPTYIASTIFIIICYIVFQKNIQGVIKTNGYLVPILLFLIIFLGLKNIPFLIENKPLIEGKSNGFLISSILYTSYNSIILIPVLVTMKKYINTKKDIKLISIIGAILIILLSFCVFELLLKCKFNIQQYEMPLLNVSYEFGKIYKYLYGFIIVVSIFTSAISAGYSFLKNTTENEKDYKEKLIIISIVSIFISNIGFSKLVQILYPIFGVLGLIQIIFLKYKKST